LIPKTDADFWGNWNRSTAMNDFSTTKSRTGYIISFAGCPITWASKLQTQIALSTTEAEYITLSQSLREVIPMINLMTEVNRLDDEIIVPFQRFIARLLRITVVPLNWQKLQR
jgi:hypothetical protein